MGLQVSRDPRIEYVLGVLAFAGVIFIDVLQGMLIGLAGALLIIILRSSRAHLSELAKVPNESGAHSDISRHPENVPVPGVLIIRLNAPIYYANALTVRDKIVEMINQADQPLKAVLFDAAVQDALDITSADMLKRLVKRLHNQGIATYFAEVQDRVLEFSGKTDLLEAVGADHLFSTMDAAVLHIAATQQGE